MRYYPRGKVIRHFSIVKSPHKPHQSSTGGGGGGGGGGQTLMGALLLGVARANTK